jgi:hypothetical protein
LWTSSALRTLSSTGRMDGGSAPNSTSLGSTLAMVSLPSSAVAAVAAQGACGFWGS